MVCPNSLLNAIAIEDFEILIFGNCLFSPKIHADTPIIINKILNFVWVRGRIEIIMNKVFRIPSIINGIPKA